MTYACCNRSHYRCFQFMGTYEVSQGVSKWKLNRNILSKVHMGTFHVWKDFGKMSDTRYDLQSFTKVCHLSEEVRCDKSYRNLMLTS